MGKQTSNFIISLLVFVTLTLTAGYLGAVLVDSIGVTGNLVTIITFSLLFAVYAWMSKIAVTIQIFFLFIVQALGSSMLTVWITDALTITDALVHSIIFSLVLFVVIGIWSTLPQKSQMKKPQVPKI